VDCPTGREATWRKSGVVQSSTYEGPSIGNSGEVFSQRSESAGLRICSRISGTENLFPFLVATTSQCLAGTVSLRRKVSRCKGVLLLGRA